MASSVNLGFCLWLDGATYTGLLGRTQHVAPTFYSTGSSALQVMSGVLPNSGQLAVTPGTGLSVTVATGACVVANSSGASYGAYLMSNMASGTLTVATADTSNPRIDVVCVTVSDVGTSSSFAEIQIITGIPAATPAAASAPANSLVLAQVAVAANATSITSGNITPKAALTVAAGGVLPVAAGSAPTGYTGGYIHDTATGVLKQNTGAGVAQAHVLPFTPVMTSITNSVNVNRGTVTVASLSFAADGLTDFAYSLSLPAWNGNPSYYYITLNVDGSQVWAGGSDGDDPLFNTYFTSGGLSTTPGAGTHTLAVTASADANGGQIVASSSQPIQLRAAPVSL